MYVNKTNGSCVRPPSGTRVPEVKHPSRGGNPNPQEIGQIVINMCENGDDIFGDLRLMQLRHQKKFPYYTNLEDCRPICSGNMAERLGASAIMVTNLLTTFSTSSRPTWEPVSFSCNHQRSCTMLGEGTASLPQTLQLCRPKAL